MVNYPQDIEYRISLTPSLGLQLSPGVISPQILANWLKNSDKYQNLFSSLTELHPGLCHLFCISSSVITTHRILQQKYFNIITYKQYKKWYIHYNILICSMRPRHMLVFMWRKEPEQRIH